jgi:hypothetical protein
MDNQIERFFFPVDAPYRYWEERPPKMIRAGAYFPPRHLESTIGSEAKLNTKRTETVR